MTPFTSAGESEELINERINSMKAKNTKDYALKVVVYQPSRGSDIAAVTFGSVPATIRQSGYVKIEVDGSRLVLKRSDKTSGRKCNQQGLVMVQYAPMVEKLEKFVGRYNTLNFDAKHDEWYVDASECLPVGIRLGSVKNKASARAKSKVEKAETVETEAPAPVKPAPKKDGRGLVLEGLKLWITESTEKDDYDVASKLIDIIKEVSAL